MKTIENLLAEYKIRSRDTEKKFTDQLSKVSKIFAQNLDSIFAEIQ